MKRNSRRFTFTPNSKILTRALPRLLKEIVMTIFMFLTAKNVLAKEELMLEAVPLDLVPAVHVRN
jgi:hypothetical protein